MCLRLLTARTDDHIFTSLPRSGTVRGKATRRGQCISAPTPQPLTPWLAWSLQRAQLASPAHPRRQFRLGRSGPAVTRRDLATSPGDAHRRVARFLQHKRTCRFPEVVAELPGLVRDVHTTLATGADHGESLKLAVVVEPSAQAARRVGAGRCARARRYRRSLSGATPLPAPRGRSASTNPEHVRSPVVGRGRLECRRCRAQSSAGWQSRGSKE